MAVTTPLSTLAIFSFSDVHVTFLFVALSGIIVASKVLVSPISNVTFCVFNVISSTGISSGSSFGSTVILHVAVFSPSSVITVIVVSPSPMAVTTPLSTLAIFSFSDIHVTFLFVALSGIIVASKVLVSPIFNVRFCAFSVTPSTGISSGSGSGCSGDSIEFPPTDSKSVS